MNPPPETELPPDVLLEVRGLTKHFPVYRPGIVRRQIGLVRAVEDLSFSLRRGEALGLVGESGSGKTTAARCILRALRPTAGSVRFRAKSGLVDLAKLPDSALKPLRQEMQMIFQDPFSSLNPRMTVGDIVAEPLVIHRLARGSELDDRVADVLLRVGLKTEHRERYPHAFSGGQRQRIGIARALIMRPAFIVADEAVSALDVSVQAQVLNLLQDLGEEFGLTYLFVGHNLDVVRHFCDRVAVLYAGRLVEIAPADALFRSAAHPYTRELIAAVPQADPDVPMSFAVEGEIADPSNLPPGCAFHPRCRECHAPCRGEYPSLRALTPNHQTACHLYPPSCAPWNP